MRIPPFNPYIAAVIGVIALSLTPILVELASGSPASVTANYFLLFAVLIISPFVFKKYRQDFRLINKKQWLLVVLAGIFFAVHLILWFESLNYTNVASSTLLISLQPILTFLGACLLLRDRFSYGSVISVIIVLFGSFLIVNGDFQYSSSVFFGDLLAIAGAAAIAISSLLGKNVRRNVSAVTYAFLIGGVACITLIIYNLALGNDFFGHPSSHWLIFLALAIIPPFLGYGLFTWTVRWISNSIVSLASLFIPIAAIVFAYLFLDQQVYSSQLLGGAVILFGLFLFTLSTKRKKKQVTISWKA